ALYDAACPSGVGFVNLGTACILSYYRTVNYCTAHQICEAASFTTGYRLYVVGRQVSQVATSYASMTIKPTSITALLYRSGAGRANWSVGDPGYATFLTSVTDTSIPWLSGQLTNIQERVGMLNYSSLYDATQNALNTYVVVCQLSTVSQDNSLELFGKDLPTVMASLFLPDTVNFGCFDSTTAISLQSCAYKRLLACSVRGFSAPQLVVRFGWHVGQIS
ncbi:unnamed protein product, partial [Echinostoma caproni]|uniref:Guanylate cyclase domain-containing protein n=1 Tax=Echinostoma caproni TaxID=27848 RepID=A0A183AG91_9TREM